MLAIRKSPFMPRRVLSFDPVVGFKRGKSSLNLPLGQDFVLYKFYVRITREKIYIEKKAHCSNWHLIREVHSLVTTDFLFLK